MSAGRPDDSAMTVSERDRLRQAAESAWQRLDALDLEATDASGVDDVRWLRRIDAAVRAVDESETHLAAVVAEARAHGHSWTRIGRSLGVSHQRARQRYG